MAKKTCNLMTLALLALLVAACSTLSPEEKAARKLQTAMAVERAIDTRTFRVEMEFMKPYRGMNRRLTSTYDIKVSGDTLYSYLPYLGGAYNLPYGGGKGLIWDAPLQDYVVTPMKKGYTQIEMTAFNGEDYFLYVLDLYPNGSADLYIRSRERDPIAFSGNLVIDYE